MLAMSDREGVAITFFEFGGGYSENVRQTKRNVFLLDLYVSIVKLLLAWMIKEPDFFG